MPQGLAAVLAAPAGSSERALSSRAPAGRSSPQFTWGTELLGQLASAGLRPHHPCREVEDRTAACCGFTPREWMFDIRFRLASVWCFSGR
jgi:hypothetical protein